MTVHDYHSIRLRSGLYALALSGTTLANTLLYLEPVLPSAWYTFALVVTAVSVIISLDILKNNVIDLLRQRRSRSRQNPSPISKQPLAAASRASQTHQHLVKQTQITLSNGDVVNL